MKLVNTLKSLYVIKTFPAIYIRKGVDMMKGYLTSYGYMGYIQELNKYQLFATEYDYIEYMSS